MPEPDAADVALDDLLDAKVHAAVERALGIDEAEPEPEPTHDPLNAAARHADERRTTLIAALTGRPAASGEDDPPTQPAGFDGGARRSVPERKSPERAHNEIVTQLAHLSRAVRHDF